MAVSKITDTLKPLIEKHGLEYIEPTIYQLRIPAMKLNIYNPKGKMNFDRKPAMLQNGFAVLEALILEYKRDRAAFILKYVENEK